MITANYTIDSLENLASLSIYKIKIGLEGIMKIGLEWVRMIGKIEKMQKERKKGLDRENRGGGEK